MFMDAVVISTDRNGLLVSNEANGEEVFVNTRNAGRFSPGDRIRIRFSGQMSMSIPPQITATSIQRLRPIPPVIPLPPSPQPTPNEIRAIILRRERDSLTVRDTRNRQTIHVVYPFAHHFCVNQQVIIRYDTIMLSEPPRVTAIDILPVC